MICCRVYVQKNDFDNAILHLTRACGGDASTDPLAEGKGKDKGGQGQGQASADALQLPLPTCEAPDAGFLAIAYAEKQVPVRCHR